MAKGKPAQTVPLECVFFRTKSGTDPVRDWLKDDLSKGARQQIGADIKTVQATWPIGPPLVKSLGDGLWEVRSTYKKVEYRTIFVFNGGKMVLLHGFQKSTQKTPTGVLSLALARKAEMEMSR